MSRIRIRHRCVFLAGLISPPLLFVEVSILPPVGDHFRRKPVIYEPMQTPTQDEPPKPPKHSGCCRSMEVLERVAHEVKFCRSGGTGEHFHSSIFSSISHTAQTHLHTTLYPFHNHLTSFSHPLLNCPSRVVLLPNINLALRPISS